MDTRVVLLGIIVENTAAVEELNAICQSALCRKTGLVLNALGLFYRRNTDREGSS